jgi:hypothetical protein
MPTYACCSLLLCYTDIDVKTALDLRVGTLGVHLTSREEFLTPPPFSSISRIFLCSHCALLQFTNISVFYFHCNGDFEKYETTA